MGRVHLPTEPTTANGEIIICNVIDGNWTTIANGIKKWKPKALIKSILVKNLKWYFIWSGNLFSHVKCIWTNIHLTLFCLQVVLQYKNKLIKNVKWNTKIWSNTVFELHKFEPIELERYRYELIKKELNEYEPVIWAYYKFEPYSKLQVLDMI